jgi:hypothetical protein
MFNIKRSDLRSDKYYNLAFKIESRIKKLQMQFRIQSNIYRITACQVLTYNTEIKELKKLHNRLVNYSLISHTRYKKAHKLFKRFPEKIEDHSRLVLGNYIKLTNSDYNRMVKAYELLERARKSNAPKVFIKKAVKDLEEKYYIWDRMDALKKLLEQKKLESRKYELLTILEYEIAQCVKEGGYMIFNTLTVSPDRISAVFDDTYEWSQYIKKFDRIIGREVYGSVRKAEEEKKKCNDAHQYLAVIERGKNGQLMPHIHVLHICKDIPSTWKIDPNLGRKIPNYREIKAIEELWNHNGHSNPKAVRINTTDSFGKLGWRMPVEFNKETKRYETISCGGYGRVVGYLGKYMSKEFTNPKKDEVLKWRVRKSRNLGMKPLKEMVKLMTDKEKRYLMMTESIPDLKLNKKTMPLVKLKRMTLKSYVEKLRNKGKYRHLLKLTELLPQENIYNRYRRSLKNPTESHITVSYGDIKIMSMKREVISKIKEKLKKINDRLFEIEIDYRCRGEAILC